MTPTKDKMVLVQMYVNGESGSASTYVPAVVLATRPKWVDVALGDMVFTFAYDMFTDDRVPEVCSSQFDHFQSRIEWEAAYAEERVAVDVAAGQAPRGLVEVLATPGTIDPLMRAVTPDSEGRYPDCLSGCDWRGKTIHDPACPHAPKPERCGCGVLMDECSPERCSHPFAREALYGN